MKSKITLATLCTVFLSSDSLYGYNCPSIPKDWDGKTLEASGPITWSVGKITKDLNLAKVTWQAHQAWILTKNKKKHDKYGYFQCVYKAIDNKTKKTVGKLTIASPKTPELEKLAAGSEFKGEKIDAVGKGADEKASIADNQYSNKDKTVEGSKCTPTKGSPESLNKFPAACEIVERPKKE
ncbi:MAG: hypothetical protein BGO67_12830 [Alphaproteobacteria bacterium 41-28]|nr:MAG: hypothetical protein BGO67_12830 [Alphaproteobacteria bacterium 41-28]